MENGEISEEWGVGEGYDSGSMSRSKKGLKDKKEV